MTVIWLYFSRQITCIECYTNIQIDKNKKTKLSRSSKQFVQNWEQNISTWAEGRGSVNVFCRGSGFPLLGQVREHLSSLLTKHVLAEACLSYTTCVSRALHHCVLLTAAGRPGGSPADGKRLLWGDLRPWHYQATVPGLSDYLLLLVHASRAPSEGNRQWYCGMGTVGFLVQGRKPGPEVQAQDLWGRQSWIQVLQLKLNLKVPTHTQYLGPSSLPS
jgi:hypothetical protein